MYINNSKTWKSFYSMSAGRLYGILSKNDLGKHRIPEGSQRLFGHLILICEL